MVGDIPVHSPYNPATDEVVNPDGSPLFTEGAEPDKVWSAAQRILLMLSMKYGQHWVLLVSPITLTEIPLSAPMTGMPLNISDSDIVTEQYTASVFWEPGISPAVIDTVYTATLTITPLAGYMLTGVSNFTVAGASVNYVVNSNIVEVVFPAADDTKSIRSTFSSGDYLYVAGTIGLSEAFLGYATSSLTIDGITFTNTSGTQEVYLMTLTPSGTCIKIAPLNYSFPNIWTQTSSLRRDGGYLMWVSYYDYE